MHRTIINFLFFLVGFFLVAVPALVLAATYPATINGYRIPPVSGATPEAVCKAYLDYAGIGSSQYSGLSGSGDCLYSGSYTIGHPVPNYSCPNGGTLNGNLCEKTCPAGETLNPDGSCTSACPVTSSTIWLSRPKSGGGDPSGSYCTGGCTVSIALDLSAPLFYESASTIWMQFSRNRDGTSCSGSNTPPTGSGTPPNQPVDDVPCNPGQGVISSSAGKVQCVDPSKVPESDSPTVKKETKTKTYPDGSQTITTTVQTCSGTGACSTTTTVTNTPATGGGTGKAGEPGTTTESADVGANVKDGETQGDFCAKNPTLQICKGGMATEDTLKKVATEETLKKLTDAPEVDDSPITSKGIFDSADLVSQQDSAYQRQIEAQRKGVTGEPGMAPAEESSNKSAWQAAMESGWFTEIPSNGCTSGTISVAGHVMTLDWCDRIAQISQIFSYALWIGLVFGVFTMMTGGKGN